MSNPTAVFIRSLHYYWIGSRAAAARARATTSWRSGPDGANLMTAVTITNVSATRTVAFFLRADVRQASARGPKLPGGSELKSSMWNDNDISLWPGESETLDVTYHSADLRGATPVITVSGQNVPTFLLPAAAFSQSIIPGRPYYASRAA